jgi:hypothetical protein
MACPLHSSPALLAARPNFHDRAEEKGQSARRVVMRVCVAKGEFRNAANKMILVSRVIGEQPVVDRLDAQRSIYESVSH